MTDHPKKSWRVAIAGGDGIGPEVTAEGARALSWFVSERSLAIEMIDTPFGIAPYKTSGVILPPSSQEAMESSDAILFGAVGGPEYADIPPSARRKGSLLEIRRRFDLYANLRPVKVSPSLLDASSLKASVVKGVDIMFVRELTSGVYFGEPRGIETLPNGERRGVNTHVYTTSEIRRVARSALEIARTRTGRVCSVAKENVMEAGRLWREEVQAVHDAEFPDVELTHMLADNCAMQLVRAPAQFDVIVTDNLFGDLLSDCAAMTTGSLGMLPSASLGARVTAGRRTALYEPVHGSAPDLAGQGVANPLGSILSVAMMLRYSMECPEHADLLERAVADALQAGARTVDIAAGQRALSTRQMGDAVIEQLQRLNR